MNTRRPNARRPVLLATGATLATVMTAVTFAWLLLHVDGDMQSMKLNHAIMDEASASPLSATPIEAN
jgi:hypothetical protein